MDTEKEGYDKIRERYKEYEKVQSEYEAEFKQLKQLARKIFLSGDYTEKYIEILIREEHPRTPKGSKLYEKTEREIRKSISHVLSTNFDEDAAKHFANRWLICAQLGYSSYSGKIEEFTEEIGLDKQIKAWANGVPLDDLLA